MGFVDFRVTALFRCFVSLPTGEGRGEAVRCGGGCEGMGMGLGCEVMGCGGCLSQLLVQRYKINQRAPNNRAKITEKSEKRGFRCGCNALAIR